MVVARLVCLLALALAVPVVLAGVCVEDPPATSVMPKWYHRPLPGTLGRTWVYDGISPFIPNAIKVNGNNMKFPLVGRGDENPLKKDPFGAGMRISTHYAYLGGRLCATISLPNPTSGTIIAMYLIDSHPKGSERGGAKWREADLEWLGSKPTQVQTSMFEMGQEQPHAQEHDLPALLQGATQRDPVRYCIDWDLLPKHKKYVRFTAKGPKSPNWVTIREWTPPNAEVDKFWNEPLRAIFTFWSNRHIAQWSGPYNIPAGKMLWADIKDVAFVPKGYAYCVKPDNDLEPSAQ